MANSKIDKQVDSIKQMLVGLSKKFNAEFYGTMPIGKQGFTLYAFGARPDIPTGVMLKLG